MEIKGTQLRYDLIDFKKVVTMMSLTLSDYTMSDTLVHLKIDSDVKLGRLFRRTIYKMEDSNKETSLKAFKILFL